MKVTDKRRVRPDAESPRGHPGPPGIEPGEDDPVLGAGEHAGSADELASARKEAAELKDILGSEGLERIEAEGRPFDPTLHDALMQGGEAEGEPVVADVLRPGYTMKGRVIRPAGVRVVRK